VLKVDLADGRGEVITLEARHGGRRQRLAALLFEKYGHADKAWSDPEQPSSSRSDRLRLFPLMSKTVCASSPRITISMLKATREAAQLFPCALPITTRLCSRQGQEAFRCGSRIKAS